MSDAVIPHFVEMSFPRDDGAGSQFSMDNIYLGEVQEVIYPDDDRNLSRRFPEFKVVAHVKIGGVNITKMFDNCMLINRFGSIADHESYTFRADAKLSNLGEATPGQGSKVLIACINGEGHNAVIIGGISDQKDESQKDLKKDDKHHRYLAVYNGINVTVNNDGELIVTFNGKTKNDGKLDDSADEKASGSVIKITKDGNISISDKDDKNQLLINHKDSKVAIKRDKKFEIGGASDKMILGTSFRDEQKAMHNKLKSYFKTLKNLLQQAGTQLTTASSTVIPPGGTLPTLAPAGALLVSAANVAEQIGQAIDGFEQKAQSKTSFLSDKDFCGGDG